MITTAVTGFIVAILAFLGITPSAWLVGAIWLAVKAVIVIGAFALAGLGFKRSQAAEPAPEAKSGP